MSPGLESNEMTSRMRILHSRLTLLFLFLFHLLLRGVRPPQEKEDERAPSKWSWDWASMTSSIECTGASAPQLSLPVHGAQGSTRRERPAAVGASSVGSMRMSQRGGQQLGPPAASHPWAPEKKSFSQQDNNKTLNHSGTASRPPSSSSAPSSETILRPGTALPQTSMERSNLLAQSLVRAHRRDELPHQSAKVRVVLY